MCTLYLYNLFSICKNTYKNYRENACGDWKSAYSYSRLLYKLRWLLQSEIETTSLFPMLLGPVRSRKKVFLVFFLASSWSQQRSTVSRNLHPTYPASIRVKYFNSWPTIHVSQVILGRCQRDYFLIIKYVVLELEGWLGSLPNMVCARLVIREIDSWVPISFQ